MEEESVAKCFVPDCKNTDGLPFPEDENLKNRWLESLEIKDAQPNSTSFVCLDHFSPSDFTKEGTDEETSVPIHHLKTDALPKLVYQEEDEETPATPKEYISENNESYETNKSENLASPAKEDNDITTESVNAQESDSQHIETVENDKSKKKLLQCRLCGHMQNESYCKYIFDDLEYTDGKVIPIADAVTICIRPMKISRNDKLSKVICKDCLHTIKEYYNFREFVLGMDEKQKEIAEICSDDNEPHFTDTDFSDDELELICNSRRNLKTNDTNHLVLNDYLVNNTELKPQNEKEGAKSEVDKKFDKVEEELRKVLEGHLSKEQINAENIIIAVENDEDSKNANNEKLAKLSPLRLPIIINKANPNQQKTQKRKVENTAPYKTIRIKTEHSEVFLPSEIKVSIPEMYTSEVGVFDSYMYKYLDYQFCIVDNYLFQIGLNKGHHTYLRCVIPSCRAMGVQKKFSDDKTSRKVNVEKPHNHRPPELKEFKKQLFLYIMRKHLSDNSVNFRNAYEEIIRQDPEVRDLIPLRAVLKEICKHQQANKIPTIDSFEQFYNLIEEDCFQKVHFTHNNRQFYQERFCVGSDRAILFANLDVVKRESHSKLMYVDASFRIYNSDYFSYQLVTVLVWIEESYYPIVYVLVNRKSQDIYKKVFEYLHDVLAPNLRPDEIVTDYESNLYYALGETYTDSHIGGSVFYYTQNLYKKICSMGIARELEVNSYFRNIYHMLLMLPLLPVNTIIDGLNNIEIQANEVGLGSLTCELFEHLRMEWIQKVTPELFCIHRLENRINENVIPPFKKLRDYLMVSRGKIHKNSCTIVNVVEKLIELEHFIRTMYDSSQKRLFIKDLSSSQKKNIIRAWQFIESHPKININNFFAKVLGYIKCMENQLWIWGFYRYEGGADDDLINAANFSINHDEEYEQIDELGVYEEMEEEHVENESVVMEAVVDEQGGLLMDNDQNSEASEWYEQP